MQSQRTFIAAISAIMLRLRIFLEIMKALNEEMTIFKLIGVRRALLFPSNNKPTPLIPGLSSKDGIINEFQVSKVLLAYQFEQKWIF